MAFTLRSREQGVSWAREEGKEFVKEGTAFVKEGLVAHK